MKFNMLIDGISWFEIVVSWIECWLSQWLYYVLIWKYESGWDWVWNWDWDCVWLNWNDNLVVNWIWMVYVLIMDYVIVDWIVWLGKELDYLIVWLDLVTQGWLKVCILNKGAPRGCTQYNKDRDTKRVYPRWK